jgi:uncharacterized protein
MSIGRILLFLVITSAISFGLHYFVWVRIVRDASLPPGWHRAMTIGIVSLGVFMSLSFFIVRFTPRSIGTPVAWIAFTWMGMLAIWFFTLVPMEVVRLVGRATFAVDADRRLFLSRAMAGAAGFIGLGVSVAGMASALSRIGVAKVKVTLDKFPKSLDGYTIVQMSDIHVGPTIGRDFIEQLVATANAENADMVVITGDLVDGSVEQLGAFVEPLKDLRAKDGVYFVTGNHEYYSGADAWIARLSSLGIRVLRNERLPIRDGAFDLAGVDDTSSKSFGNGHGQDVARALLGRDASKAVVLLAHQPKAIFDAAKLGVDLQLSGHTHGGQIWPWGYAVKLDQPHVAGLATHAGSNTQIYTSRGTGYWGPPMRVGAPAEVTRIELYSVT